MDQGACALVCVPYDGLDFVFDGNSASEDSDHGESAVSGCQGEAVTRPHA